MPSTRIYIKTKQINDQERQAVPSEKNEEIKTTKNDPKANKLPRTRIYDLLHGLQLHTYMTIKHFIRKEQGNK